MNNKKYNYVIYHKNCTDGFTGFFILHKSKTISLDALIYPDHPSAKYIPPNIEDKDIIIIDVAYKYEILKQIILLVKSITFIDHHITIKNDVEQLKKEHKDKNITIIYDLKKSGASLTWDYFFPNVKVPRFIKYIEDNDIGAWKLKDTMPFISALTVKYDKSIYMNENINKWNKLFDNKEVSKLIKIGKIYSEYGDYLVKQNSNRYSIESFPSVKIFKKFKKHFKKVGQYKVAVYCGSGCPSNSQLGKYMVNNINNIDFVMIWNYNMNKREYIISFISKEIDVGSIAKLFGGGGHMLASACSIRSSVYNINDMFEK